MNADPTEPDDDNGPDGPLSASRIGKRKAGPLRWLVAALALTIALLAATAGISLLVLDSWARKAGPLNTEAIIIVKPGSGLAVIARQLEDAGVISNARWLIAWTMLHDAARSLKAGEYAFAPGTTPHDALSRMQAGETLVHALVIPEGLTVVEILDRLEAQPLLEGEPGSSPAEGTLLPETYYFHRGDSRTEIISRMQDAMARTIDGLWDQRQPNLPIASKQEALTLASIVEKETGVPSERARVAGVFINRLRRNMRLQSDPTVIYALTGGKQALGRALTRADWKHSDPYNTYQNAGLPPGPIANPGRASIEAVLNPEAHKFLFFVADGTGGHAFAETYAEHQRNIQRARQKP